ncbi:unnamed protein product [Rotaria socialis]|uniref:C2H2-type domain-containing protein n=1 Tax=Rotaria socialis TaxID=392032 RepID=A0A821V5W7_9BILA|nr:unnamed protein product [Rotaria socialis]CAF4902823.1 unnamed protein product [Rotaria socialis]
MEEMSECCLYDELGSCSSYMSKRLNTWSTEIVNLNDLKDSSVGYLVQIGVISKFNQGSYEISECNIILNRLSSYIDIEKPYLKICSLHRYTFGIGWRNNTACAHLDHKDSFAIKKRKRNSSSTNRILPFHLVRHTTQFPYGGRICGIHLREIYSRIKEQQSAADEFNTLSEMHSYEIQVHKNRELENTNTLLMSWNQSPIHSQTTVPLEDQEPSSIRRLTAKLRRTVSIAAANVAESIAPGQGEMLLQLANLDNISKQQISNTLVPSNTQIDEQYLDYLIKMYKSYDENNLPFNEQVRVLTLIPKSWNLSSTNIQKEFNCSRHAVKISRRLRKNTHIPLHIEEKIPKVRQRLDPTKLDYFLSWIIETNLLISIPWGSTSLKLDSGDKISIPQQMLQAQQSQIVHLYKEHCSEVGIDSMSDRTIYTILESIHASEQKFVSGIDEFVKAASEGWALLQQIIQKLPIQRQNKHDMSIMLETSKLYLKSKYAVHCSEDEQTKTHCSVFALSKENDTFYSQACNHTHGTFCQDCILIAELFDQIENSIHTIVDKEARDELLYDLTLVWESIFQLMGHRIRAVQQEQQKKKYIEEMDATTAFLTVDWSQKILPQQFKEGQSSYFGKRGMSLLVGSFAFKEALSTETISKTYMLALTSCCQNEHTTLCAAQIILQQFHHDYPHIVKLIKRSDNASVLAGQSTIQCENFFSNSLGIKLLMRDYSEIQCGKSVCDRMSGSAKLRMRAYINAGNDVESAFEIKKAFEYGGGIQNLKIGVGEVSEINEVSPATRISELSSIRNIIYNDTNIILRKASGIGIGRTIDYEDYNITPNVTLVSSFEKYDSSQKVLTTITKTKRSDRMFKTLVFCPNESCIDTFEKEEDLNVHILLNQHTIKRSSFRSTDKAKLMLFEKIKNDSTSPSTLQSTATTTVLTNIPRHYKVFAMQGWALRARKPAKSIDKAVKEFIKSIFEEEKIYGRKTPVEEYVTRIRTARNNDGTKKFNPSQYLTYNQVQNQIKMLSKVPRIKKVSNTKTTIDNNIVQANRLTQPKTRAIKKQAILFDDETSDDDEEEDERAVKAATRLENFRKTILNDDL